MQRHTQHAVTRSTVDEVIAEVPVLRQDLHGVRVTEGDLIVSARDVHNYRIYYYQEVGSDGVPAVLKPIPNYRKIHIATLSRATSGTGAWVLRLEKFRLWLNSNGVLKILWGSGMPGAGKTVLASIVIHALEGYAKASLSPVCVNYLYVRYSDRAEVTVQHFLEVLVKQTVERHPICLHLFDQVYANHIREETQPSEEELLGLLQSFTGVMRVTFVVIDALDEAPPAVQLAIVKKLSSLNLKLFITSRPLKALEAQFSSALCFKISAQDRDLSRHIDAVISNSTELSTIFASESRVWRDEVIMTIKSKCRGMFLHASLQLEALRECTSSYGIKGTLERFPTQIQSVYLQTWGRILNQTPDKVSLAKRVLLWVLNASSLLTVEQLRHAVATSPETHVYDRSRRVHGATLVGLCCGLVAIDEESGIVHLVHDTAKDALDRLILETFPRPHSLLAAVCMAHLTACGFQDTPYTSEEDPRAALKVDPLLAYAYQSWSYHARKSWDEAPADNRLEEFVSECYRFPVLLYPFMDFDILGPLHVAAFYNLPIALAGPDIRQDLNLPSENVEATPLYLACLQNARSAIEELLRLPEVLVNAATRRGRTALIEASRQGDKDTVTRLLAHPHIDVNLADEYGATAVSWASRMSREGIVRLLLCHRAMDVNLADDVGRTPLIWASLSGDDGTVKALLRHSKTNVNLTDEDGVTAVSWASRHGRETIVRLLLTHPQIDVNLADETGRTPLMGASLHDDQGTVVALLAHSKTDINLQDADGWTALIFALRNRLFNTARVLLSHPTIDVKLMDKTGRTPLMWASHYGDDAMVETLLAHPDTEVDREDKDGWTALICAAREGRASAVKILLSCDLIDVHTCDTEDGWTALMAAIALSTLGEGHERTVEVLLAHPKVDVNGVDKEGRTVLILATQFGTDSTMKMLLAHPQIDVNGVGNDGATALIYAARDGRAAAVELLLAHPKTNANATDNDDVNALEWAFKNSHEVTVDLLLSHPQVEVSFIAI